MRYLMFVVSVVLVVSALNVRPSLADAENDYLVGLHYFQAQGETDTDAKAFAHLQRASDNGHVKAQFKLGEMYLLGRGTEKDYGQAFSWWRRAATAGNATAQYRVGLFYETGYQGVVSKDLAKARDWYALAAAQGYAVAATRLHNVGGENSVALTTNH